MAASHTRILLVDDDPRNLLVLTAQLASLGHELVTATSSEDAVASLDAAMIDLVLLDMDFLAVLQHVREHGPQRHMPVILLTAVADRAQLLRSLEAGADELLEPIDGAVLRARVQTLLKRKQSYDALATAHDIITMRASQLEQLQREQRELMQFIVHDLKTPLNVASANLEWAQEHAGAVPISELRDALTDAHGGVARLRMMIEDLLAVSQLEDSSFPVQPELISISEFVRPLLVSYERRAEQRSVRLTPLPENEGKVWADPTLLRRVLENILDNSLRYTPTSGNVEITLRTGDSVEIVISNDGPPIAPEDRERIFEKFTRGQTERPVPGGTGLGLYFCKRVVEAHGGQICVRQTDDWPTSFVIELPPLPKHFSSM